MGADVSLEERNEVLRGWQLDLPVRELKGQRASDRTAAACIAMPAEL